MSESPAQIVSKLKIEHPKIYKELTTPRSEHPKVPKKRLAAATRKAKTLAKGKNILVPVCNGAFLVGAQIYWECSTEIGVLIHGFEANKKASTAAEKELANILWELAETEDLADFVDNVREEVLDSDPALKFFEEVEALDSELCELENNFDFEYDRDIGVESEWL